MKKIFLCIVLINLLTACAGNKLKNSEAKPKDEPVATAPAPVAETATVGNATTADVNAQALAKTEADAAAKAASAENAAKTESTTAADSTEPKRSVYFPFDVDVIQDNDKPLIQAHGAYLSEHPERKSRVEGNADERGSSEYNLALGQRRANNTKKALVLSGAKADQIETISYGEEKPKASGHDEASWAQNRRADINY